MRPGYGAGGAPRRTLSTGRSIFSTEQSDGGRRRPPSSPPAHKPGASSRADSSARSCAAPQRGQRISAADALSLLEHGDLERIGEVADAIRRRRFPEGYATFIVDRNINYTNVCVVKCSFCAFYRLPGHEEGYRRTPEEIFQRVEEALDRGATQIMFQGGHDPKLTITYYEDLLSSVKARYPVTLHSLSPSEVHHIARYSRLSIAETLRRLKAAGLDSLPGGGAEILSERVKQAISPLKNSAGAWIEIMDEAHRQGLRTTATMMLGHVETLRGARRALPARARIPGPGPARRRDRARATAPSSPGPTSQTTPSWRRSRPGARRARTTSRRWPSHASSSTTSTTSRGHG